MKNWVFFNYLLSIKYHDVSPKQLVQYMQLWVQSQFRNKINPVSETIAQGKAQFYTH